MITNAKKEATCKKYFDIIEIIYELGNGLFFRKDLFHFAEKFYGYNKVDYKSALTELQWAEVIEFIKVGNVTLIKLKKYGLRHITGLGRESVSSITITGSRINKLAFYIGIIWKIYERESMTFTQVLNDLNRYSSFFLKEKQGHLMLQQFKYLVNIEDNTIVMVENEIMALNKNYSNSINNLDRNNKLSKLKLNNNESTIVDGFNPNNILKLNYFVYDFEDVFNVYIIDYRQNIFIERYLQFIKEAYNYFSTRFKKPIKFVTVGNNTDSMFIANNDILLAYFNDNRLESEYRNGMLKIDVMYIDTVLKVSMDYTTIKKNMVLTREYL